MVHLLFFHYCISGKSRVNNGVDALPIWTIVCPADRIDFIDRWPYIFIRLRRVSRFLNTIASKSTQLIVTSGQSPQRL